MCSRVKVLPGTFKKLAFHYVNRNITQRAKIFILTEYLYNQTNSLFI